MLFVIYAADKVITPQRVYSCLLVTDPPPVVAILAEKAINAQMLLLGTVQSLHQGQLVERR